MLPASGPATRRAAAEVKSSAVIEPLQRTLALLAIGVFASLTTVAGAQSIAPADGATPSVRYVDLNGDGLVDKLISHGDHLTVELNRDFGDFDPTHERLPAVDLTDVLLSDLDGDGQIDLYLVSRGENVALRGDGTGRFSEATEELGLADGGRGLSAERLGVDSLGGDELLLHNADGDVLFWSTGNGFRRDAANPESTSTGPDGAGSGGADDLAALEQLIARAAELLALDPDEVLVLGIDGAGQPQVSLGPRYGGPRLGSVGIGGAAGDRASSSHGAAGSSGTTGGSTTPGSFGGYGAPPPPGVGLTTEEQAILDTMSLVNLDDGFGNLVNPTVRFSGVNVQVVNSSGSTTGTVDGVGNLIVGYNELGNPIGDDRTGSHNLVLGMANSYLSFGGLVGARDNTISGAFATVSGGQTNQAKGAYSTVTGGMRNTAKGIGAAVNGGWWNSAVAGGSSISGGRANKASGKRTWVGGGKLNIASGKNASVGGGLSNAATSMYAVAAGGRYNTATGDFAMVSGGRENTASGDFSMVSGGRQNTASGPRASVSGGLFNTASGDYSSASGGRMNTASGWWSSVSAGLLNTASGYYCSVSGGIENMASSNCATVSGGSSNEASGNYSSISGGVENRASNDSSSVSGGFSNTASGYYASVTGGYNNLASGSYSSVSSGYLNVAYGNYSSVSGGQDNTASGDYSSVSGGNARTAANVDDWVAGTLFEDN